MKYRLLEWLACPACRRSDLSLATTRTSSRPVYRGHFTPDEVQAPPPGVDLDRRQEEEVEEGALHCGGCGAIYPIRDGIPRMMLPGAEGGPASGHRFTGLDLALSEWEESFRDYSHPLQTEDFLGRLVLDAGCGFGRHAFFAARYGAEVIAIDHSPDAVEATARNCAGLERVHVIQGDLSALPLREDLLDIACCYGVLHHVEQPHALLAALTQHLKPGGTLSLWVYGPRQGATLIINNALRGVTTGLEPEELLRFSRGVALGLRLFSHTPYLWLNRMPVVGSLVSHLPVHDHYRWPFPVVVADVYDRLRIPVRHWFTGEELEAWFTANGFADIHVSRRVRNNETFRALGVRR